MHIDVKDHSTAFGWVGVTAAAMFAATLALCFAIDPVWDWVKSGDASNAYAFGCVISGILLALYGVGRVQYGTTLNYCFAGIMITLSGICLVLNGVLVGTEDVTTFLGIVMFVFIALAIIAVTIDKYSEGSLMYIGVAILVMLTEIGFIATNGANDLNLASALLMIVWVAFDAATIVFANILGGKE